MKKLLFAFITLTCLQNAIAQSYNKLKIELAPYYNKDNFRWSIAGDTKGENPNILSELIYNPVKSAGFDGGVTFMILEKLGIHVKGQYGKNFYGKASDADYEADDRQEASIAYFDSKDGYQYALNTGVNFTLVKNDIAEITVDAGYHLSRQLYKLTSDDLPNLNARYKTTWSGFYAKAEAAVNINKLQPFASLKLVPLNYHAVADWNLRTDFQRPVSFKQRASGLGYESQVGLTYHIDPTIAVRGSFNFGKYETNKGTDIAYLIDATPETQFNGGVRKFTGVQAGIIFTPF